MNSNKVLAETNFIATACTSIEAPVETDQVILKTACGLDVHKKFVVAVIKTTETDGGIKKYKKRFSTFMSGLNNLKNWLHEHDCKHVCMESTGKYWIPVFNVLEPAMEEVRVCNPKWLPLIKGEKDDNKDASRICDNYKNGQTEGSYIPSAQIRELRDLSRLRKKYIQQRSAEHNRLINCLTVNNYKLDMVFSDVRGQTASRIINLIISGNPYTKEDILACVHGRCRAPKEDILDACMGIPFTDLQAEKLQLIRSHIHYLDDNIRHLDGLIAKAAGEFEDYVNLLVTIPGIDYVSARHIIAELGTDMTQFKKASQLAKWAGLAPGSDESAGKVHTRHITKGGRHIKPILVQAAWAAVRAKKPYYGCKFHALSPRMNKKRAIIAIARKMLVAIYHMFKTKSHGIRQTAMTNTFRTA